MKKLFFSVCAFFCALCLSAFFTACSDLAAPKFNAPVEEFFKKNTDMAMVAGYGFNAECKKDRDGVVCVPSGNGRKMYIYIKNPNGYSLGYTFVAADGKDDFASSYSEADSMIIVDIPDGYLELKEGGGDFSPTISLFDVGSGRDFGKQTLNIRVNTPPPEITGATVMMDSSGNYVICFNLPSALAGIHNDLKALTINGTSFTVSVTGGSVSITGISKTAPSGLSAIGGGAAFSASGQVFYYSTGIPLSTEAVEYTITLTDSAGLSSSCKAQAEGVIVKKLSEVRLYKEDAYENIITGTESSPQVFQFDENGKFTVYIKIPTKTTSGVSVNGVNVIYKVYEKTGSGYVDSPTENTISANSLIKLPFGEYKIECTATKTGYTNSDTSIYYVKSTKDDLDCYSEEYIKTFESAMTEDEIASDFRSLKDELVVFKTSSGQYGVMRFYEVDNYTNICFDYKIGNGFVTKKTGFHTEWGFDLDGGYTDDSSKDFGIDKNGSIFKIMAYNGAKFYQLP